MNIQLGLISIAVIFLTIIHNLKAAEEKCFNENFRPNKPYKNNLYRGETAFTIDMLKAINKATPNENIFFSPYSTYHALLLAYFGSAGSTEKELEKALYLNWPDNNKGETYSAYKSDKKIRGHRRGEIEFSSADKIFLAQDFPIRECMKSVMHEELQNMNFRDQPDESRNTINNWVEDITQNQIKDFLKQGDITSETQMVLANAAYFKGQWDIKFNKSDTKMEVFHIDSKTTKIVNMMHNKGTFYFGSSEELKSDIIELSYKGGYRADTSMLVILPYNNTGSIDIAIENLTPENLKIALDESDQREVNVSIPRFDFDIRMQMTPILNDIGINEAFSHGANFSELSLDRGIILGDTIHVAKIQVDEEGTTAAAATAALGFKSGRTFEPTSFICDRPFIFLIFDRKNNAILFSGVYRKPKDISNDNQ